MSIKFIYRYYICGLLHIRLMSFSALDVRETGHSSALKVVADEAVHQQGNVVRPVQMDVQDSCQSSPVKVATDEAVAQDDNVRSPNPSPVQIQLKEDDTSVPDKPDDPRKY